MLVFETVQQAHDVPCGSCFEAHCKWTLTTISESSCQLEIQVGTLQVDIDNNLRVILSIRDTSWCTFQEMVHHAKIITPKVHEVEELSSTERDEKEFGSTTVRATSTTQEKGKTQ